MAAKTPPARRRSRSHDVINGQAAKIQREIELRQRRVADMVTRSIAYEVIAETLGITVEQVGRDWGEALIKWYGPEPDVVNRLRAEIVSRHRLIVMANLPGAVDQKLTANQRAAAARIVQASDNLIADVAALKVHTVRTEGGSEGADLSDMFAALDELKRQSVAGITADVITANEVK